MIKAVVITTEGPMMILGLSKLNVERLTDGQPILFDLGNMGYRLVPDSKAKKVGGQDNGHRVLIAAGEDEQAVAKALGIPNLGRVQPGEEKILFRDRP